MSTRHDHERNPAGRVAGPVLAAVLLLIASGAWAVPQIESIYGGQNAFLLPEINAMGGTGTALYRGGLSGLLNPALLTDEPGYRLDGALAADNRDEQRFMPLYDTFESYVTDVAIASNRQTKLPTGFAAAGRLLDGATPLVVSLSLADRYSYAYLFEEQIRDPDSSHDPRDQILEERSYETSGTLRDLSLGAAVDVTRFASLGASLHYAFGTRHEDRFRRYYTFSEQDSSYAARTEWDLDGVNVTLGARIRVSERVELGVSYESRLTASGDLSGDLEQVVGDTLYLLSGAAEEEIEYPAYFRAGLTLRPRTDPRTVFTADVVYANWDELTDSRYPEDDARNLNDVVDVRIGARHTFYNGMQMLFGFRRYDSYYDRDTGTSVFSGGVGTPLAGGRLTASLEVSKVQSIQPHIFPYPDGLDGFGNPITADPDARVADSQLRFGLGYTYGF